MKTINEILQKIQEKYGKEYTLILFSDGSGIIKEQKFYIDNVLFGFDEVEELEKFLFS